MHRRAARILAPLRRGRLRGPTILLYHRIGRPATDPQLLSVAPERFAEHLQVLVERYEPTPLSELVPATRSGAARRSEIAVTFDDGYSDNLAVAKPLLERAGVPVTVFVTSGHLVDARPFWWDELSRLLLFPGRLPSELTIKVGDDTVRWELGGDALYAPADARARESWTVLASHDPGPRQRLYRELCTRLRALDELPREQVLAQLRSLAEPDGAGAVDEIAPPRPLNRAELLRLVGSPLVDVGAHTVTHPQLTALPADRQREEVEGSRLQLEEALGHRVCCFSYPYGGPGDVDALTVSLVRGAGFDYACANVPGALGRRSDPFLLPRLLVRDWDGNEFADRLLGVSR